MKTLTPDIHTPESSMGSETRDSDCLSISSLNHERVSALAYELWEARGRPEGSPEQDWHRAEALLTVDT